MNKEFQNIKIKDLSKVLIESGIAPDTPVNIKLDKTDIDNILVFIDIPSKGISLRSTEMR